MDIKAALQQLLDSIVSRDRMLDDIEHNGDNAIPPTGDDYNSLLSEVTRGLSEILTSIPKDPPAKDCFRVVRAVNGSRAVAIGLGLTLSDAITACAKFTKLIEFEYGGKDEFYIEPDC